MAGRTLLAKLPSICLFSRSFASRALPLPLARSSPLLYFRPLVTAAAAAVAEVRFGSAASAGFRCFSTRPTTSSLNDQSPNWSNRPPKETILLDGCDFEHWLVVMDPPEPTWTRDEIIDSYIKTLAEVLGSEEEARMSIYSVSTKHYFAFGCKVSEEISYKIKPLQNVRWVLPDSYLDVKNKDYGGEPFIDGKPVPYDPKYHEEWVRNNARAQERSRRNDRPRNFDRSRNFERRRENMQNFQNREASPAPNQGVQNAMPPRDVPPPSNPPPIYQNQMPNQQSNYGPPNPAAGYQGSNQGYQGGPGYQGGQGYQGGSGHPGGNMASGPAQGGQGYQGGGGHPGSNVAGGPFQGGQGYQGGVGHPGGNMAGGPAQGGQGYQGGGGHPGGNMPGGPAQGGQGYQGGGGHSGGNMPGGPAYQESNRGNYQSGGPPGYQGNSRPYQGGFSGYQPSNSGYQGVPPSYQQGGPSYQGEGASPYPGREVPGRDE